MKLHYVLLLTLILSACGEKKPTKGELIDFVPQDASVVLKISDINSFTNEVLNNDLQDSFQESGLVKIFSEKDNIFQHLAPKKTALLCLLKRNDSLTDYAFLTVQDSTFVITDSIESLLKKTAFTAKKDSVFIATSSPLLLTEILEKNSKTDPQFKKIFNVKKNAEVTAIYEHPKFLAEPNTNFASQTALDLSYTSNGISATGVALARDTTRQLLNVFKGQIPQQNDLETVVPANALWATSFTFSDAALLIESLQDFRQDSLTEISTDLFESINEVGHLRLKNGQAVVLKSIDPELTEEELAPLITEQDRFREITLFNFDTPTLFQKSFSPFVGSAQPSIAFQWEHFFVFCEGQAAAESIITAIKNNGTLEKTAYFNENNSHLSNASSLLFYGMDDEVSNLVSQTINNESLPVKQTLNRFPFAALQYSYDRDFAHVNFVCKEASKKQQVAGSITQLFSLSLEEDLLQDPQLFTNHRTKGKDVIAQDISHQLHLISGTGKVLWKKQLSGPILGKIHEVDLLRNGKKQLAFTTEKAFFVLDRNGKEVQPFPKKFRDKITQPLSVFDYDNKRKYRFVVTQGKEVFMYDSKGKIVSGFTYKKANSPIVLPPQHIRVGNKDYLAIAEKNGTLNLLSRVGKERVKCSSKFDFSQTPIAIEGNNFVVIDKDNKKHSISSSGRVTSKQIQTSGSYHFVVLGNTKVTLDDNLLRINGKLVELPYGIYTRPQLFKTYRRTYIAVTETQENKVYVYDKSGVLINGFPVYGTTSIDLSSPNSRKAPLLVVKGETKEILLYSL